MNKVYVIKIAGCEGFCIEHICASESTARRRFKDVKLHMLQRELHSIMFTLNDYIHGECIFANESTEEKNDHLQFSMEQHQKMIQMYDECTFDHVAESCQDKPVCSTYDLEE